MSNNNLLSLSNTLVFYLHHAYAIYLGCLCICLILLQYKIGLVHATTYIKQPMTFALRAFTCEPLFASNFMQKSNV